MPPNRRDTKKRDRRHGAEIGGAFARKFGRRVDIATRPAGEDRGCDERLRETSLELLGLKI